MPRGKSEGGRYTPRRRARGGGDDESTRWLATYADAVTLLMAFFILLYAMSEIDLSRFAAFVEGLQVPFGNVAGDDVPDTEGGLLPDSNGLQPEHPPEQERFVAAEQVQVLERVQDLRSQLEEVREALDQDLAEAGLDHLVEQRIEERGLRVSIASDDILFALGSTELDDLGRRVIRTVAGTLEGFTNPLTVEGHTDNVPLTRPDYTNWNLSTDRAVRVLELMVEQYGLPPDRVGAVGYGEHRPLHDNSEREGRARNRRVDIVVLVDEEATA